MSRTAVGSMAPGFSSKYSVIGSGANNAGILQSIKVSESNLPRPPSPAKDTKPCPTGKPFAINWTSEEPDMDHAERKLFMNASRRWCESRGRQVQPPPLTEKVERLIQEWFQLVDADGSGFLDVHELELALLAAEVPCTPKTLSEMLELMDFNRDNLIDWQEFHTFISYEVHAGQDLLGGELVLPSGLGLPLQPMIHKLRRTLVMKQVFKGGDHRKEGLAIAQNYLTTMKDVTKDDMKPSEAWHMSRAHSRSLSRSVSCAAEFSKAPLEPTPSAPSLLSRVPDYLRQPSSLRRQRSSSMLLKNVAEELAALPQAASSFLATSDSFPPPSNMSPFSSQVHCIEPCSGQSNDEVQQDVCSAIAMQHGCSTSRPDSFASNSGFYAASNQQLPVETRPGTGDTADPLSPHPRLAPSEWPHNQSDICVQSSRHPEPPESGRSPTHPQTLHTPGNARAHSRGSCMSRSSSRQSTCALRHSRSVRLVVPELQDTSGTSVTGNATGGVLDDMFAVQLSADSEPASARSLYSCCPLDAAAKQCPAIATVTGDGFPVDRSHSTPSGSDLEVSGRSASMPNVWSRDRHQSMIAHMALTSCLHYLGADSTSSSCAATAQPCSATAAAAAASADAPMNATSTASLSTCQWPWWKYRNPTKPKLSAAAYLSRKSSQTRSFNVRSVTTPAEGSKLSPSQLPSIRTSLEVSPCPLMTAASPARGPSPCYSLHNPPTCYSPSLSEPHSKSRTASPARQSHLQVRPATICAGTANGTAGGSRRGMAVHVRGGRIIFEVAGSAVQPAAVAANAVVMGDDVPVVHNMKAMPWDQQSKVGSVIGHNK